jgi:glutamate:GABA antiporter
MSTCQTGQIEQKAPARQHAGVGHQAEESASHKLRRSLGLRDLIPMQVLLVVGITWAGIAARQGGTHVAFWLAGVLFLFLPVAALVDYCSRIWPLEGGVYQWTRHGIGPFAGFLSAWNFGVWALLAASSIGITTATALSYAAGPAGAWIAESRPLIATLNVAIFALTLAVNIPGFGIGRWIAHLGTAVMLLVMGLLALLVFFHPHATAARPHVSPQKPFSLAFPALTMVSLNLFSKLTFNGLTGLEQVAVFAGEIRQASRTILRSAWIAAPGIALIYILMTGSMLTYTPADKIDLNGPIPQVLATAFANGAGGAAGLDWGVLLGRAAILAIAIAAIAQNSVVVAETSRLPMVAAWDHLIPAWFTRLHPRYRTPSRSLTVIVVLSAMFAFLASSGAGAQEAYQLLATSANICYGVYYLLMLAVPLVAGARFGRRAGIWLRAGCVCALAVTLLAIGYSLVPIVDVANAWAFAAKVGLTALAANMLGILVYWRGSRREAAGNT